MTEKATVLALDAAWTYKQPTGVAVLVCERGEWRCVGLAPSYECFLTLPDGIVDWEDSFRGSEPEVKKLLHKAAELAETSAVDLVAIDMPVAICPIEGRRQADDEISKTFGHSMCGTHSPNRLRPGLLGEQLTGQLKDCGFPVATKSARAGSHPHLLEVYPHPALLRLLDAMERVPYKVSKAGKYWPHTSPTERIRKLLERFDVILSALAVHIADIPLELPSPQNVQCLAHLKKYEDALDALISGWAGMRYLKGEAEPFGDDTAAIWIPIEVR